MEFHGPVSFPCESVIHGNRLFASRYDDVPGPYVPDKC